MSLTKEEVTTLLESEVKSLTDYLDADDYSNALDDASRETGWSFPVSTSFKEYWIKNRAKRHLFFYLLTESARKFKIKTINLNQSFDHYYSIIFGKNGMDEAFIKAQEENPAEFLTAGMNPAHLFGTKVDAGFQYEPQTGKDTTYTDYNKVNFTPKEND